jgi:hypothetical protein
MGMLLDLMSDKEAEKTVMAEENIIPVFADDSAADDAFAKVLWAKAKIEENEKLVKAKKAELKELLDDYDQRLNGKLRSFVEYRTEQLKTYAFQKLKGKKGSYPLLHGNVQLKEDIGTVELDAENEAELIKYLRVNGIFDKCAEDKVVINKTKLRSALTTDKSGHNFVDAEGNIIHGAHINKKDGLQVTLAKPRKKSNKAEEAA